MTTTRPLIDLTLLKKLLGELETQLSDAEQIPTLTGTDEHNYFAALAKASGLCSGVIQEATGLIADCYRAMQLANGAKASSSEESVMSLVSKALGKSGGSGGAN